MLVSQNGCRLTNFDHLILCNEHTVHIKKRVDFERIYHLVNYKRV